MPSREDNKVKMAIMDSGANTIAASGVVADLPQMPASDVKKRGWRAIVRTLASRGAILVTNHAEPEAVIVSTQEYERLIGIANASQARTESELDALRRRFDDRLAALHHADAGDRLRTVLKSPTKLRGKVKAGAGY